MEKKFYKNIITAFIAQGISLSISFIFGFFIPKIIDEYQYAYWQTYVLYVGYVGVLHFGLLDGLILRYSQYDFKQLDKERIRSQFKILLSSTVVFSLVGIMFGLFNQNTVSRMTTIFVAIGIVTKNLITYNSYLFQMTNRIDKYSLTTIVNRIFYGIFVILLLINKVNGFELYCIADILSDSIGIILSVHYNRGMFFGKSLLFRDAFEEWKTNVSSGIILMLCNWSSLLLNGLAKMIIQWHWDILIFGKVSFAFSISGIFLTFISVVSVVLFPQIKRINEQKLPQIYLNIRSFLSPLLFIAMLAYYPGCYIIEIYLPKYSQSLIYLGLFLPIIICSSKVSILTNSFLKAYRKEREMFKINIISLIFSTVFCLISAYIFNNINLLLICIVISNFIKSFLSEQEIARETGINLNNEYVYEGIMIILFILFTNLFERYIAFCTYLLVLFIYLFLHKNDIKKFIRVLYTRFGTKK